MRISDWSSDVCSSDLAFKGPVVHVLDASRAVGVATALVSETQKDDFVARTKDDYDHVRKAREGKGQSKLLDIEEARANAFEIDESLKPGRSEEHTSELQSLMRISYAVFCLKKKNNKDTRTKMR